MLTVVGRHHWHLPIIGVCACALFVAVPVLTQPAADDSGKIIIDEKNRDQIRLTPEQQAIVDKVARSPETVNVSVVGLSAKARDQDGYTRFYLPLEGGKEVVLTRTQPTMKTERGLPGAARLKVPVNGPCLCFGTMVIYLDFLGTRAASSW